MNNGNGTFSRDFATQLGFDNGFGFSAAFLQTSGHISGATWGDVDNDGDLDCYIAASRIRARETLADGLYLNDGFGNFSKDTTGVWANEEISWGCSMADFNADGFLDIVSAHPANFLPLIRPSSLFINQDGNPSNFKKDTTYGFTKGLAPYTIPYWSDFDLDGDQDFFMASGPGGAPGLDSVYLNTLVETGTANLVALDNPFSNELQDGQCYSFVDYDNDGDKDLFITNWVGASNNFYRNDEGVYTKIELPFSYNNSSLTNSWADVDNDGDQDVVVTNWASSRTELYLNEGGEFILSDALFNQFGNVGAIFADVENDGKMDLYLSGPMNSALYRNIAENNHHYVHLQLEGTESNRAAIGANVLVYTTKNGNSWVQMREVSAQNSFQGHSDLRLHFGLGEATSIDSIIVMWPSRMIERFYDIDSVDRIINIKEGGEISNTRQVNKINQLLDQISISPNPGQADAIISDENPIWNKRVYLFNNQGKLLEELEWAKGVDSLNLSWHTKPSGIYWIQITADNHAKAT
ncbi:MAG: FG-GAP-like repeat-containing protein, partial [Bacteroidota bacterium]